LPRHLRVKFCCAAKRVIAFFLPLKLLWESIPSRSHKNKREPIVKSADRPQVRAFQLGVDQLRSTSQCQLQALTQKRLHSNRAARDIDQLDMNSVFLEDPYVPAEIQHGLVR